MITRAAYQDPITFMFTRHLSTRRKVLMPACLPDLLSPCSVAVCSFFSVITNGMLKYDNLITDLHDYMADYFKELRISIDRLQPLTLSQCHEVSAELTSRAAFSLNVRAFLLVKR
ncbi:phage resistance protein [Leclercia adecarboxylata]|uniref:Phage resistance protein n=1 Tax=Leclercia adecarboxylata TaxID=83655 RepID=A0A4U9I7B4_9ENTR|nr:phage resistance protein [Leclercia adecarboxylata]